MKQIITILILVFVIPLLSYSQVRKKSKDTYVYVSTSLNYTPAIEPYSFLSSFQREQDLLLLNFLTPTAGTFTIEDGEVLNLEREDISHFPSQLISVGASVQIVKADNSLFHEISLTKTSFSKSSYVNKFSYLDSVGERRFLQLGYEQRAAVFGARYEVGTYFNARKTAALKFGLSGAIEPSFYFYKREALSINEYPIKANIMTLDIAIIPMVAAKLSKKVLLEFKVIPNILIADFGTTEQNNPTVSIQGQEGIRSYDPPEINVGASLLLKYQIKEPKKKRRRKKTTEN